MFSPKRIFKDKKAGEKILSIWWFFVLAFIGLGVVGAVVVFASAEFDIKEIEAGMLADRVADCIVERGILNKNFINQGSSFELFKNCNINEDIIKNSQNYYLEISAYDFSSCNVNGECTKKIEKLNFSAGMNTFPKDCKIKEKVMEAQAFPRCSEKTIFVLNKYDESIPGILVLKILAGSNQKGKQVMEARK